GDPAAAGAAAEIAIKAATRAMAGWFEARLMMRRAPSYTLCHPRVAMRAVLGVGSAPCRGAIWGLPMPGGVGEGRAGAGDGMPGRSDVNTVIVLRRASVAALNRLAPLIARWRRKGFALPVLLDRDQVEHARLLFPMELNDIKRQHRVLAGEDPFA